MRLLLSLLFATMVAVTLGCGGGESSYKDREAPAEEVNPSETMDMMGPQPTETPAAEQGAAEGAEQGAEEGAAGESTP